MRLDLRLAAASVLGALLGLPVTGQPIVTPDERGFRLGNDLNRYEMKYGAPEFRSLDDELDPPEDWPLRRSIRTEGRVWGNRGYYGIDGKEWSLSLQPAEELLEVWAGHMPFWAGRRVRLEVAGAFDPDVSGPKAPIGGNEPQRSRADTRAFLVWEVAVVPDDDQEDTVARASLEELVANPDAQSGRSVTVEGTFRGANLFRDMAAESQRDPSDWVLNHGAFFVWVTGREPRGTGFSLDPAAREDCRWRLEVTGTVEVDDGYVYLNADEIRLLGPARE